MLTRGAKIGELRVGWKAAGEGIAVIRYVCDRCGLRMDANDPQRFIVKLEIYAAAGPVDLDAQTASDVEGQWEKLVDDLARADPNEVEDRTYRCLRFDVCDTCRQELLKRPLG